MRGALLVARLLAGVVAVTRLARARRRLPPLAARLVAPDVSISVVVPARDEERRIGPLLETLSTSPGVSEVIVVDDESSDATATLARSRGASVVAGAPLPPGWAGKAWALQQGVDAATGEWVVTLDADTRPSPGLPSALVARARQDRLGFVTVAGRFECPTPGVAWLHPAMLTTLVYRFGPPDSAVARRPSRLLANGQCTAFARRALLDAGGFGIVRDRVVEDVALARALAERGWDVAMLDGQSLLTTRMFETLPGAWRGWARSLALPGVEPLHRQITEALVIALAQVLPIPRLLTRRGDPLDVALLALRLGTLAGTAGAYERRGLAYWMSPLADVPALAALVTGVVGRRRHRWRGRTYT